MVFRTFRWCLLSNADITLNFNAMGWARVGTSSSSRTIFPRGSATTLIADVKDLGEWIANSLNSLLAPDDISVNTSQIAVSGRSADGMHTNVVGSSPRRSNPARYYPLSDRNVTGDGDPQTHGTSAPYKPVSKRCVDPNEFVEAWSLHEPSGGYRTGEAAST
ncbi:hypothetical protein BJ742DRAFT_868748 [Cladochytrium replicatum]|nr:hypothetical protein BJ742DRAFT_868748 [Cladochytrium replicatum]